MQEGTTLQEVLHVGGVDSAELAHTFSSFYNMASQHDEEVQYNRDNHPVALVAVYADGDLTDVLSGPGFRDEDLGKIKAEVEDSLFALDPASSRESWERMRTRYLTRGVLLSWLASKL